MVQGDLITADALNAINIDSYNAPGHAGWSYWTVNYYYTVSTQSGATLVNYTSSRSAGCSHSVTIYRYEDGAWVEKYYSQGSGSITQYYASCGPGIYWIKLYYHNNTPYLHVYPTKTDNVRGNLLVMMQDGVDGSSVDLAQGIRTSGLLTAENINKGLVYTI